MNLKIILYALIFTASSLMFSGFPAGTQIKIPGGYKPIEQLCIGDLAFAVKPDGNCTITSIVQTASYTWHKYMIIEIDGELIISVTGQKFYNPIENRWIKAKHLQKNTPILSGLNTIKYISSSQKIYDPIEVFDIRLKDTHTFCVGNHDVVVHNFLQFTIGFSIAWGCGVVTFEAFWQACIIGLVALGMRTCSQETNQGWKSQAFIKTPDGNKSCEIGSDKIFIQNLPNQAQANPVLIAHSTCPDLPTQNKPIETCNHLSSQKVAHSKAISSNASNLNEPIASLSIQTNIIKNPPSIHNYPISQHSPGKDCGTITCSPPPKGPHGYFIPSEKHKAHQSGQASAGPTWEDGQKALDTSVEVENKGELKGKRRVTVYGGKYIVFDQTSPGVYHAHHRTWNKINNIDGLTPEMKEALEKSGMVTGNKGKIIKDAKKNKTKGKK